MTRTKSIGLRERLTTLLPSRTLWRLARETGFVVRDRKIKPPEFLWTLVFGFALGRQRTLAGCDGPTRLPRRRPWPRRRSKIASTAS